MSLKFESNAGNKGKSRKPAEDVGSDEEEIDTYKQKANEYVKELIAEKASLENKLPNVAKLLEEEIERVQKEGRLPPRDYRYVDVYRDKSVKVIVKALVPVREHPRYNFVGKLLGPKGNTMKALQEDTMCRISILGRGSMRDRQKEEELRNSSDPRYRHLSEDLHVQISAIGPPAEAHARIAYALAEVQKFLIPDNDMSMGDAEGYFEEGPRLRRLPLLDAAPYPRPPVGRSHVVDENYGDYEEEEEEEGYGPSPQTYKARSYAPDYEEDYYSQGSSFEPTSSRNWKPVFKPSPGPSALYGESPRFRKTPYFRPAK